MNLFEAALALVKAGEENAESAARGFAAEVEAHLEGLIAGLHERVAALEAKIATDATAALTGLSNRVAALETSGGLTVDDATVTAAIAGLTAPPAAAATASQGGADPAVPAQGDASQVSAGGASGTA